jgi:hypothetical protein
MAFLFGSENRTMRAKERTGITVPKIKFTRTAKYVVTYYKMKERQVKRNEKQNWHWTRL